MPPWAQSAMPVSPWTPDPPFTPFTPDTPDRPLTPQTPHAGEEERHVSWQRGGKEDWRQHVPTAWKNYSQEIGKKCRQRYGNEGWPDSWQGDSEEEEVKKSHDPWQGYGRAGHNGNRDTIAAAGSRPHVAPPVPWTQSATPCNAAGAPTTTWGMPPLPPGFQPTGNEDVNNRQHPWQGYSKEEVGRWHDSWHRHGNAEEWWQYAWQGWRHGHSGDVKQGSWPGSRHGSWHGHSEEVQQHVWEKDHTSIGASCGERYVCPLHGAHELFVETAGSYEEWISYEGRSWGNGGDSRTSVRKMEQQGRYAQSLSDCVAMFPDTEKVMQQIKKSDYRVMLEVTSTSASSDIQIAMASARYICNHNCIRCCTVMVMLLMLFCIGPQQGQRLLQSALLLLWQGHGSRVLQGGERHPGNGIDTATGIHTNFVIC